MGSKKRSAISADEIAEDKAGVAAVDAISKPLKKKPKKDDKHGGAAAPSSAPTPVQPMEKKKERKAFDKERRRSASKREESQPEDMRVASKANDAQEPVLSTSTSGLPEFHISVFQRLASADTSVREAAAETLVRELQDVQKAYDSLENKDLVGGGLKLEAEKDDGLENCAPSLRYAVRRLVRGVSSSRECARPGFALGLSSLICAVPSIKVYTALKLIVDLLEVSSSMKGQEVRDCLLGRLFAYGALAQSGRLIEEWVSDKNTPCIKEFVSALISLAGKKRYLQEPAVSVILELVEKLPAEALLSHVLEAPGIIEWFEAATVVGNPDALLLALRIREKISTESKAFGKLLPNPFCPSQFFSADHLTSICNCLKESTFCQPRVHSVWPVLVNILVPDTVMPTEDAVSLSTSSKKHKKSRKFSSSEEEVAKSVRCFCEVVIEGSLLLSSHDRKHLALDVLLLLLRRLPSSLIPIVLSQKLIQGLMDILSTKDSWLYKVAQNFLKELLNWVSNDDVRRVAVIMAFQKHSNGKYDSITKTRTVKDLMEEFKSEAGCMLFVQNLMNIFVDEGQASEEPSDQSQTTDDNSEIGSVEDKDSVGMTGSSDFLKSWVIESLPKILKHSKLEPEARFRLQKEILKFLAVQGLFSASLGTEVTSFELQEKFRWPKAATSTALCKMCIEKIQSLLSNAHKVEDPCSSSNGLDPNDLGSYFMRFLSTLRNIPSVSFFRTLSEEDEKAVKKIQEMEARLFREERNSGFITTANKLHAMRYLLIQLLLEVLLRSGEFSDAASELIICCKKAFAAADILDSSGEDELGDETPELMDVLVDTMLSLLPQSSAPMRSAIEQVFKYFCCEVTDDGLLRMLRIIKKDLKPARHQNADNEDDDDDDELLGMEEDEDVDEAETGETAESDEQTDDSEAVLGGEEAGKELDEGSDDSDGGMDDDAMFRMDAYVARIFKEKKNQSGSETAQSQLVLFKLRVLSLLEIYLHENRGKPEVLTVYSNLAQAFVNPHTMEGSEQLGQRIWGILQKKVFKEKKLPNSEAIELSTLESLLERNLNLASKPFKRKKAARILSKKKLSASLNRQKMVVSLAQNSTYWILKIIDAKRCSDAELQRVFEILQAVLMGYFGNKKSQIKSGFLKEIFRRNPRIGQHFFGLILQNCGSTKWDFRRVEALDMAVEILKSLVPSASNEKKDSSKKILKTHLQDLSLLIRQLLTKMPAKQLRKDGVYKFCGRIFQMISTHGLTKSFLKRLEPDTQAACESLLGDLFLKLKRSE